jgi:hypothetical protein
LILVKVQDCFPDNAVLWPDGAVLQRAAAEGPNEMRVKIALASSSLFVVAQHFAGSFVDQMYAAAGRAGHNLVAVRSIGRRGFGQPHLNVHAGPDASKNELGHLSTLMLPRRRALTCLNFDAPHGRGRSRTPPAFYSGNL